MTKTCCRHVSGMSPWISACRLLFPFQGFPGGAVFRMGKSRFFHRETVAGMKGFLRCFTRQGVMPAVEKGTAFYTVAGAAEMFGITPHTVRYYTDCGRVPVLVRDRDSNRLFDREALNWLEDCLCLRGRGMSVAGLKLYEKRCLEEGRDCRTHEAGGEIPRPDEKGAGTGGVPAEKYVKEKLARYRRISNGGVADTTNPSEWENGMPVRRTELLKVLCGRNSHEWTGMSANTHK